MPISDCVSVILQCEKCHTFALKPLPEHEGLFFPTHFYTDDPGCGAIAKQLLAGLHAGHNWYTQPRAISDLMHQVNNKTGKFASRVLYQVKLKGNTCCKIIKGLKWVPITQISSRLDDCWGAEPAIIASLLKAGSGKLSSFPKLIETRIGTSIQEFLPQHSVSKKKLDPKRALIAAAGFPKDQLMAIYQEFHGHSFPSMFWTLKIFRSYAKQVKLTFNKNEGYSDHEIRRLYKSFLPYGQMYLTFKDFVLGIVCMQKKTPHGASAGFFRMERIFRFYDVDRTERLSYPGMMQMRKDILRIKRKPTDPESLNTAVRNDYAVLGIKLNANLSSPKSYPPVIKLLQLLNTSSQLSDKGLRGFSTLYRVNFDLSQRRLYATTKNSSVATRCANHRSTHFYLASHAVVIDRFGFLKRNKIRELDRRLPATVAGRVNSMEAFSSTSTSLRVLHLVHELADLIRKKTGSFTKETCSVYDNSGDWRHVNDHLKGQRFELVQKILRKARNLFMNESRIPKVTSPCIVFGDIHGNLSDLLTYESLFWKRTPFDTCTHVFLGDFVDRGRQSVEVFLYLMAMKCLIPSRILILRGNHETRPMHERYGFKKECARKFSRIWPNALHGFNEVMDCIPVAGLIDEQLFSCHGGIPFTESSIANLMKMPRVLQFPDEEYPAAMEIMWSDPSEKNEMADMRRTIGSADSQIEYSIGTFLYNFKRSVGHYFDEDALRRFNLKNATTHLLRAHEMKKMGFHISFDGMALTVFSSSSYERADNIAAVLVIQDDMIIPCQIET